MNRIIFTAFIWIFLLAPPASAQLFPGDVNNDGIVNNVDLIYLGQFFFQSGPPRAPIDQGIDFTEKQAVTWGVNFPNTAIDISFADCNGNGFIDHADLETIEINYNLTHGTPVPVTVDPGQFGVDPLLYFDTTTIPGPIPELLLALVPINLGTETLRVPSYSGIAFTINYDTDIFSALAISEIGDPWGSVLGLFVMYVDDINGKIEVATSPGPQSPLLDSYGPLVQSILIIEEDVVGITDPNVPTDVYLTDILLMDGSLDPQPIVEDTMTILITNYEGSVHTKDLANSQLKVYPNPVENIVFVENSGSAILAWEIHDIAGHLLRQNTGINSNECSIDTQDFSNGLYVLQIKTEAGLARKKIIIQH